MIQIKKTGEVLRGTAAEHRCLRSQFKKHQCILLPNLLEPPLLSFITKQIEQASYHKEIYKDIGYEFKMKSNAGTQLLNFLFNNPKLLLMFQRITGCGTSRSFLGRIYTLPPGRHYHSWHNDMSDHRVFAMSINLSTHIYGGGKLQIRNAKSKKILYEIANVGFGDAVVFQLSHTLEHRVTDVTGTVAKTAFAGWFHSQPDFLSLINRVHFKQRVHQRVEKIRRAHDFKIADKIASYDSEGETFLFNFKEENKNIYRLNGTGGRLWELLVKQANLSAAIKTMTREYQVAPKKLRHDVFRIVKELHREGLVEVVR